METRKRKYTKSEDDILSRFKDAHIRECTVDLVQSDFGPILLKKKPLTEDDIASMLEDSGSDSSGHDSDSDQMVSPRTKSRLRKNENGMVLIPRSKYNEHPAKDIVSPRKTRRNASKSIIKVKLSPRQHNKKNSSSPKITKNNNSIYKKNSSYNSKSASSKHNKEPVATEYHLVFSPPKNEAHKKVSTKPGASLADFLNIECLPSKLWEIERVPPLIPNIDTDSIAKELLALTEENKENLIDKKTVSQASESRSESEDVEMAETLSKLGDNDSKNVPEHKDSSSKHDQGEKSVRDELEALLSDADASKTVEPKRDDSVITSEDIEKTLKDVCAAEIVGDLNKLDNVATSDENKADATDHLEEGTAQDAADRSATEDGSQPGKKERTVRFKDDEDRSVIKSLIFRKYSENKKTYEKVVVFRSSMEYTVTIHNKTVELIGAPHEMTSLEDLSILLQIVDESDLDSFNVICKS